VLGPDNRPVFHVVTDANMPGYTVWNNTEMNKFALVEWQNTPLVEARGPFTLSKQRITDWLVLADDRRSVLPISFYFQWIFLA
jgi:hypothetical protein